MKIGKTEVEFMECWVVEVQVTITADEYETIAVFLSEGYAFVFENMLNEAGGYGDIRIEKRACDITINPGYLY